MLKGRQEMKNEKLGMKNEEVKKKKRGRKAG
jgi:hypothetical protein